MNDFSNIPSESPLRSLISVRSDEVPQTFAGEAEQPYDGVGWPGDGSGTDDLADYNQNEAYDYMGE